MTKTVSACNCITIFTVQCCFYTCKFLRESICKSGAFNFFKFDHKPFLFLYVQLFGKI